MGFTQLRTILLSVCLTGCMSNAAHKPADYGEFVPPSDWHVELGAHEIESLWGLADSAELAALVELALSRNPNLKQTALRVSEADAVAKISRGARLPTLDLGAQYQSQRIDNRTVKTATGVLSSSWELDVWHRLGDSATASELSADASRSDYRGARISLAANVIRSVLAIISTDEVIILEEKRLKTLVLNEQFIRDRYLAGLGPLSDLEAARTELAQRRASLRARREEQAANHRALAVLLGQHRETPTLPAALQIKTPDIALPTTVIGKRPDLVAALERAGAADFEAHAAAKALLPGLSLSFDVSRSAPTIGDLLSADPVSTLLAGITAPLFRGGQLTAERDRSIFVAERAYWAYRETLLQALREVEDALGQELSLNEQSEVLTKAIEHAERNRRIFESRYREGIADIFDLLNAQQTAYDTRIRQLDTKLARDLNRVDMAVALGLGL